MDTIPDKTTKRDLCFSASLMLTYPIVVNINRLKPLNYRTLSSQNKGNSINFNTIIEPGGAETIM